MSYSAIDYWYWCGDVGGVWLDVRTVMDKLDLPVGPKTIDRLRALPALEFRIGHHEAEKPLPVRALSGDTEFVWRGRTFCEDNDGIWECRVRLHCGEAAREAIKALHAAMVLERL